MFDLTKCHAKIWANSVWRKISCSKKPTKNYKGIPVCDVHYRQLLKWESEGREMKSMIEFTWHLKLKIKGE